MSFSRAAYVAQRVGTRMQSRGDPMTLRRVSMVPGPVPFRNPPDYSLDLIVRTGTRAGGQSFLGIGGSAATGRLVPGDTIVTHDPLTAASLVTWTVQAMPLDVVRNSDGIAEAAPDGTPVRGAPAVYSPDAYAADSDWPVVCVTAPDDPDPAASIGAAVSFTFAADVPVYGVVMSMTRQGVLNLIEADQIVVEIAAWNPALGAAARIAEPSIDDVLLVNGKWRSITAVTPISRQDEKLTYQLRAA